MCVHMYGMSNMYKHMSHMYVYVCGHIYLFIYLFIYIYEHTHVCMYRHTYSWAYLIQSAACGVWVATEQGKCIYKYVWECMSTHEYVWAYMSVYEYV